MMVQLSRMGLWRPGALTPVDGRGGERQTPGHLTRQCGGQFVQRRSDGRAQPWPERQIASVWVNPVETSGLGNAKARQRLVHRGQGPADDLRMPLR